jgi:hypothetical protein
VVDGGEKETWKRKKPRSFEDIRKLQKLLKDSRSH